MNTPIRLGEALDPALSGNKAASLARMRTAGLPVPDGLVLPVNLVQALCDGQEVSALGSAAETLGGGPLAVRSSALCEDGAEHSFAGQFATRLNVAPTDLLAAVRACGHPAATARARSYAASRGTEADGAVPLLLMPMVHAACAGVAFSADPVTGDPRSVVSAVPGLGDSLVDGSVTPDEWSVSADGEVTVRHAPHGALDEEGVRAVAALTRDAAAQLGGPCDIEWARDMQGRLWLLQARPITSLPRPVEHTFGPGSWTKDVAHYPEPMTPFGGALADGMASEVAVMAKNWGLVLQEFRQVVVAGEIYTQPVPMGPPPSDDAPSGPPPAIVFGLLSRVVPAFRARMRTARQRVRSGDFAAMSTRWTDEVKPGLQQTVRSLGAVDVWSLSAAGLLAHFDEAIALLAEGTHLHFDLFVPYLVTLHELVVACRERLGMSELEAVETLRGASATSAEPGHELASLGDRVRANPAALAAAEAGPDDLVSAVRAIDAELARGLSDWIDAWGWRTSNYDPGALALAEQPRLLASLLVGAVARPKDLQQGARADLDARLSTASPSAREAVERALAPALAAYGVREDNALWCDSLPGGLVRRALAVVGVRLAEAGAIAVALDVPWLLPDEVRGALVAVVGSSPVPDLRPSVSRRKAEYAWQAAHPGPLVVGHAGGAPPNLRFLPREGRRFNQALMWFLGLEHDLEQAEHDGDVLRGRPASAGRYQGPARIVRCEADLASLRTGEVLVCPVTTPAWSPAFAVAGALITVHGGVLSHAAIIARENGLPAVLGVAGATDHLSDGVIVTVDGSAGTVTIHPPAPARTHRGVSPRTPPPTLRLAPPSPPPPLRTRGGPPPSPSWAPC